MAVGRRLRPMNVVYHCFGGAHSSPVAAAIHLGRLPMDRVPEAGELLQVPLFDRSGEEGFGRPELVGTDERGHSVFVMGHGPGGPAAARALRAGYELAGGPPGGLLLVDTLACVNVWMRIGGYLSRRLGLVALGRPLVIWGTRRAYPHLVALVGRVRRQLCEVESGAERSGAG